MLIGFQINDAKLHNYRYKTKLLENVFKHLPVCLHFFVKRQLIGS